MVVPISNPFIIVSAAGSLTKWSNPTICFVIRTKKSNWRPCRKLLTRKKKCGVNKRRNDTNTIINTS